jgi:flagellar motor switch protein FliN
MSQSAFTAPTTEDPLVNLSTSDFRLRSSRSGSADTNEDPARQVSREAESSASNLGLLLDVELHVLLRFGQRSLTLREVLDLKCGSVVELDRRVDEPVELLLDGRVIARGDAAIVDGNYGLQITEVLQAEPRAGAAESTQGQWR